MPTYQNFNQSPQGFLKTVTIIHAALTFGQVMFGVLAFAESGKTGIDVKNTNNPFLYVVPLLALIGFIASNFLFKQLLNNVGLKNTLREKLMVYQTALIVRYALLEGASLFAIVCYLLTGNLLFLLISGAIVLYFIIIRPTKQGTQNDLNLSYEDQMEFNRTDV